MFNSSPWLQYRPKQRQISYTRAFNPSRCRRENPSDKKLAKYTNLSPLCHSVNSFLFSVCNPLSFIIELYGFNKLYRLWLYQNCIEHSTWKSIVLLIYIDFCHAKSFAWFVMRKMNKKCLLLEGMVFCYQNCSDLLWEKIVLVIEKNFWNSRLSREFAKCLRSFEQFFQTVEGQNNFW